MLTLRRLSISIKTALSTVLFLSVAVNHSHMNALCRPTSKGRFERPG